MMVLAQRWRCSARSGGGSDVQVHVDDEPGSGAAGGGKVGRDHHSGGKEVSLDEGGEAEGSGLVVVEEVVELVEAADALRALSLDKGARYAGDGSGG